MMSNTLGQIADKIISLPGEEGQLTVALSNELVQLLSEQLYQSPVKAIEELVVNSYDADATECRIFVPEPDNSDGFVAVYDNGSGMNYDGLRNLWHIGHSPKQGARVSPKDRKQIGKFGIGKLATYTIAQELTYVTRINDRVLSMTLDYARFQSSSNGADNPIQLQVKRVDDWDAFSHDASFRQVCEATHISADALFASGNAHWTLVILERLKSKSRKIRRSAIIRVLSTAMPLRSEFRVYLNGDEVASSKESLEKVFEFGVSELPPSRLAELEQATGVQWEASAGALRSKEFPDGVTGTVFVSLKSLSGDKSADLGRSHGFFVKVRGRLINAEDALFGLHPLSFQTFNRFRADVRADDLDEVVTAPREGVEESPQKEVFKHLLLALYNEARSRYRDFVEDQEKKGQRVGEAQRHFVDPHLVELPVADSLSLQNSDEGGAEADDSWFYLKVVPGTNGQRLAHELYTRKIETEKRYKYRYSSLGDTQRMVEFDPSSSTFLVNEDHSFIKAHSDDHRSKALLEDVVTAEALLEVYLRESHVPAHIIGEVLERRDLLLRSLANDHPFSLELISRSIRDAASDERALEVALVTAARALGFVAVQISNGSQPDGIARLTHYPSGERKITLEAKSSDKVPSLGAIDFAGLREHVIKHSADGCLLVAPSYPGSTKEDDAAAAVRACDLRISCWTTGQLSRFVAAAEKRHLTAQDVLDIVLNHFSPSDVSQAVDNLLDHAGPSQQELYVSILEAFKRLDNRLKKSERNVNSVATVVSLMEGFQDVEEPEVDIAIKQMAAASQGSLIYRDGGVLVFTTSWEELERRIGSLTGSAIEPRRSGSFRE